jgi:drug/metabolite transporter (DMT)-like permease
MWIPITLAAATFQILRTSRQHELRSTLSTAAAGFVRYAYGAPLALLLSFVLFVGLGRDVPSMPGRFWPIIAAAAVCQILATIALLRSFKLRDFAVGTVYSKSEVLIVAGVAAVGLGTPLEPVGWIGAVLVTIGVAWLASAGSLARLLRRAGDPAALMGLIAGAGFAGAAIGIRAASRALTGAPSFDRAVVTLTILLAVQTAINVVWFLATDRHEITATTRAWRPALWVGVFSLLGSIGWAWAFTLESAAKVRTLGQVELIIAFGIAHITLGDRHTRTDYLASATVLAGVVIVAVLG